MSASAARAKLDAARKMRMLGETDLTRELSSAAYFLAVEDGDGETAYHAHACLGKMHLWRAEYDLSYVEYREALRLVEGFQLKAWLAPAHHDCFISGHEAGYRPDANCNADPCLDDWHLPGARTWAFVHDLFRALVRGNATRASRVQAADFLKQSAISASWCIKQPPPGGPWYPEYQAKFERATVFATLAHASGLLVADGALTAAYLQRMLNLFEMAADELGSNEGYALNLIDAALGARAGGLKEHARNYLNRASVVANSRSEDRIAAEIDKIHTGWNEDT
jgi:hypothetical protein